MSNSVKAKIVYFFYNTVWFVVVIPFLLMLLWRYRHSGQHSSRFWERLSVYKKAPKNAVVWVHVASVGEALGCMPLLIALKKKYGNEKLLVTTTTPSGESIIYQHLGEDVSHAYLPFDLSFFMRRFLGRFNPRVLLIFETEIWPSMVNLCHEKSINTILVNARMSEKSKTRYSYFSCFSRQIFSKLSLVAAQSRNDAVRLQYLGATNVVVMGNIKSDISLNEKIINASKKLRLHWQGTPYNNKRKILLAASTHSGEEEIVLEAYADIKKLHPGALLVLAPRHSDRFDHVWQLCSKRGFSIVKRSSGNVVSTKTDIVLADTIGELLMLLGTSDVVIMGGTFVDHGGHNLLEPAIWGIPIVAGKSHYNFSGIAQDLLGIGSLIQVDTSKEVSETIEAFLANDNARIQKGNAAKRYVQEQKGSLEKLLSITEPYIDA